MSRVLHTFLPIFVLTIGLWACGKSKETCQREAADVATMFASMDTTRGIETRFVKLVRRDDLAIAPDEFGVVLEVSAEGVRTYGVTETPQDLESVLGLITQRNAKPFVLLAIDAATPWKNVAAIFATLEARGFAEVGLVFARKPVESQPPPRSAIDDKLDEAEKAPPGDRATKAAQLATELVRDCEAIHALFTDVSGNDDKAKHMIDGLPPALVECRCRCDVPSLKSLMYRLLVNRAPTTTIHVKLGGKELALAESALWSEAALKLSEGQAFKAVTQAH